MTAYGAGFDPDIGMLHALSIGRESLACDQIEPLRPLVDDWIAKHMRQEFFCSDDFSLGHEGCLLQKNWTNAFLCRMGKSNDHLAPKAATPTLWSAIKNSELSMRYLITYYFTDKRRLQRVQRHLQQYAFAAQRSVYLFEGTQTQFLHCFSGIEQRTHTKQDDVRFYRIANLSQLRVEGCSPLVEGIFFLSDNDL